MFGDFFARRTPRLPRAGRRSHGRRQSAASGSEYRRLRIESLEDRQLLSAAPLGAEFRVNTYTTSNQATWRENPQAVAMDADGDFVVVWRSVGQDDSNYGVFAQRYNNAGIAQGSEFRVNTYTTSNQVFPAVAMDSVGNFVVTWSSGANQDGDSYGVYAQRYSAAGAALGSEFRVNSTLANVQRYSTVAMDSSGDFVITWTSLQQDGDNYGIFAQRYNSSGVPQGGEIQVNTYTTGPQVYSRVAMDANGNFVVTWESAQDGISSFGIYGQRFNASGVKQGAEFRVNTYTTNHQRSSTVAMDSTGNFVVTWSSELQEGGGLSAYGVYAQRYNTAGVVQGSEFRVNVQTTDQQRYSAVTMDADGDFVVTWNSYGSQDGDTSGIFARTYDSAGVPQGGEFRVNTYTTSTQLFPGIANESNGDFVIVWKSFQDGFGDGVYGQRFRPDAAPTTSGISNVNVDEDAANTLLTLFDKFADAETADGNLTYSVQANTNPSLFTATSIQPVTGNLTLDYAPDQNGNATLTIRATDAAGGFVDAAFTVTVNPINDRPTFTAVNPPSVPANSPAQTVLNWAAFNAGVANESGQTATYSVGNISNAGFFSAGPSVSPSGTLTYTPASGAYGSVRFDVTVQDSGGTGNGGINTSLTQTFTLMLQSLVKGGSQFRVNTYTTDQQNVAAIAMDADGDFVVVWESLTQEGGGFFRGIYAQRYNAAGTRQGSEFRVNTYTTNNQSTAAVAMDADGDFVVTWISALQDGSNDGVYAQRFSAAGVSQGIEFRVNSYTTGNQNWSRVAMDAEGNFVVTWHSNNQDGDGSGVYAQRFNAMGVPQGSEFKVNTYTTADQLVPSAAMSYDGDFVVTWNSYAQDGSNYGVYAQRFSAAGAPQGSEFRVNAHTSNLQSLSSVDMNADGDFVVAWRSDGQEGGSAGVFAQRFNSLGVPQGTEFRVNTYTTGHQMYSSPAMDAAGNLVIAWRSDTQDGSSYGVFAQRFNADGLTLGSEFLVNTYTSFAQNLPQVVMNAEGDFVVTWSSFAQDGSLDGVYAQRYDELSDTAGPIVAGVFAADTNGVAEPGGILTDERLTSLPAKLVVTFSESMATTGLANINSIHNWKLARNGVDISSQISGITFGFNAANNRYEALLSFTSPLSDGSYELTAQSTLTDPAGNRLDGDLNGSRFGEDDTRRFSIRQPVAAGSEFRVNTNTAGAQRTFFWSPQSVASDSSGNFTVTWSSYGQDGSGYGVYAQRYSAAGVTQGSEFRVNSFTTSQQRNATIAMDLAGDFVVAWTSYAQDGNSYGIYAQRFNADGSRQGSEFQVNTYTTNLQTFPMVAMDADGDFVIAWSSSYEDASGWGVCAQRYNSAGVPQGSEFRVNAYTTGNQIYAAVAMDASGDFVITWSSNGQDGGSYGVYARRYSAVGVPLGTEFRVNTYTSFSQEYSTVGMDAAGNFVITWSSFIQEGGWSVYGQRFNAAGSMQGSEFRINSFTTDVHQYSSVAVDADGDFFVTWSSFLQDGTWDVLGKRFSAIGVPQGSEFRVNSTFAGDQSFASATTNSGGDLVVAWTSTGQDGSGYGVYAQRYAATAVVNSVQAVGDSSVIDPGERLVQSIPSGLSLQVAFSQAMSQLGGSGGATSVLNPVNWMLTKNGIDISNQIAGVSYSGTIATLSLNSTLGDGNYVLTAKSTIQDADGRVLDGDSNGTPGGNFTRAFSIQLPVTVGSEFRVNTYTTGTQGGFNLTAQAVAADASGDYVVTWTSSGQDDSSYGIYAQRYNAAGLPLGGEFRVNSYTTGLQLLSSVAMSDTGGFVVTWSDFGGFGSTHTGIFAQPYDAAGVPQGSEFQVNSYTTGAQLLSSIALDADGDFVITWSSLNQDGSGYGIYAQRFSADGVAQGGEFRVNTYTTSAQRNSAVAMDAGGNFVVTWQSYEQDGNQYGIYAQRYSASGTPLGSEFRASTTTFSQQRFATVALNDTGDFVIAWSSVQDGGALGIYGQRFASNGLVQGSEFRINTYTTGNQEYARVAMDADGDFVVAWKSNNQDGSDYGIFAQRFNAMGTPQGSEFRINSITANRQLEPAVTLDSDGDFIVVWSSLNQDGSNYGVYAQRYAGTPPLQIVSMTPTYTGFEIEFDRDVNPAVLNLYDEGGSLGVADVTLMGASAGAVRGSVVVEPGSRKLTFIKSGGQLAPDAYSIGLRSNAAGFLDPSGNLLDGNGDGFGDDYLARFTITPPPSAITLAIGDFTRGYGQTVNLPASASAGIPITISNAVGVKSATFVLVYDPALLSITGVTLGSGITSTVSLDTSLVGIARITVSSGTQLSATVGLQTLVNLTASVPSAARYSSKQILALSSIQLANTALATIPSIDDDGIHLAAYFGDASGDQSYNAPDATATQRLIVGSNTGFAAYQLADPYLVADITGNGQVQSDDVTQIQRAIVGLSTPQIPPHPGLSPSAAGGPDPIVSIPRNLTASVGETIAVPVEILVTEPTGIELAGADIAIAYDASALELTDAAVGQLLIGFGLCVNTTTQGLIRLSLSGSPLDLDYYTSGVLANLRFTVIAGAGTTSSINVLQTSGTQETALYDAAGRALTLSPAPTNDNNDEVDGLLSILGGTRQEAAWKLPAVDMAFDSEDDFTAESLEELVALN